MPLSKISVIDLFCGCGGTSQGFRQAGMRIAIGLDMDPIAGATFRENFPEAEFIPGDIRNIRASAINKYLPARPWLFSGCAPCQPFSAQNKTTSVRDRRRSLLDEFGRFVERWDPEYVFIENVPGLQRVGEGGPLGRFRRLLRKHGYVDSIAVLPALWFGVPQRRDRLVLVASKESVVALPRATHGSHGRPYTTVRDWIAGLPALRAGERDAKDSAHCASALSPLNTRRILATPEGKGREAWPKNLLLKCHREHTGHTDVYGRLAWDKPAAGLTTRCNSLSNGRFGHPDQPRALSAREAACLQTFPRSFNFTGTLEAMARQIGNAVPPLMAQRIGEAILDHHRGS
jgi:DNA (cytosine-5)-methyltransferase 1